MALEYALISCKLQVVFLISCLLSSAEPLNVYDSGPDITMDPAKYKFGYEAPNDLIFSMYDPKVAVNKYSSISPPGLHALAHVEAKIYEILTDSSVLLNCPIKNQLQNIQEYIKDYQRSSLKFGVDQVSKNPLTVFLMVRRFRNYIQPWINLQGNQSETQNIQCLNLESLYNHQHGPFRVDLHTSIMAIVLAHYHLDLRAEDIAEGIIHGTRTQITLEAKHCVDIGMHSIASGIFTIGVEWLEVAVRKTRQGDLTVDSDQAADLLTKAKAIHDIHWAARDSPYLTKTYFSNRLNSTQGQRVTRKSVTFQENNLKMTLGYPVHLFWSVCKGDSRQSEEIKSKLFCYYEYQVHPTFRIGPLKAEFYSLPPATEIVQYYDVISENFIATLKQQVSPKLIRANHEGEFNPKFMLASYGVGEWGNSTNLFDHLTKLTERISGLKIEKTRMESSSTVLAYPPGGHIRLHADASGFQRTDQTDAHRMASMTYYLDDADRGRALAFPIPLVSTKAVKGSAIFWFNLLSNGNSDDGSLHGSCPLVLGERWGIVKLATYEDQYHLKCDNNPNTKVPMLVNGRPNPTNYLT